MKTGIIFKFYPTNMELKKLTKCKSYNEMVEVYDIPRSTIKSWTTNGIQLYKLYNYFDSKQVNDWIISTTALTVEELKSSEQYKD